MRLTILILIPVKSSFHDIIDSSKCFILLFSRMFYGIKPRWKIQVPMEYGVSSSSCGVTVFFLMEWYPISLDSVYIYICLYIWLYVHPIQFIGHPYQLVISWLSRTGCLVALKLGHVGRFCLRKFPSQWNLPLTWRRNHLTHKFENYVPSFEPWKSWNFGPLVACWGFVGDGICNTQLCGGYNNHYN